MQNKITIQNLNAWFGAKQVLHEINLGIEKNRITAIIGPSGCGNPHLSDVSIECMKLCLMQKLQEILVTTKISMIGYRPCGYSKAHRYGIPEAKPISYDCQYTIMLSRD